MDPEEHLVSGIQAMYLGRELVQNENNKGWQSDAAPTAVESLPSKLCFIGVAQPRECDAAGPDHAKLSDAEIAGLSLRDLPVCIEHDCESEPVGRLVSNWPSNSGELKVMGVVENAEAIARLMSNDLKELALGTEVVMTPEGRVLLRRPVEVSLVEESIHPNNRIERVFAM